MKKILILAVALSLIVAGVAFAGITGTSHDLKGTAGGPGEICIYCHYPHNTGTTKLLWNLNATVATFGKYDNTDSIDASIATPDSTSIGTWECLSCHDGVIGTASLTRGGPAGSSEITLTLTANLIAGGYDLKDDHPVNFAYDSTLISADGELMSEVSAIANDIKFFGSSMVQCASCHDVHDNSLGNFIITSNVSSALCLACHNK